MHDENYAGQVPTYYAAVCLIFGLLSWKLAHQLFLRRERSQQLW